MLMLISTPIAIGMVASFCNFLALLLHTLALAFCLCVFGEATVHMFKTMRRTKYTPISVVYD